jgi:hypothetical protein
VKHDFFHSGLSVARLSLAHGVSETAIRKHIKAGG